MPLRDLRRGPTRLSRTKHLLVSWKVQGGSGKAAKARSPKHVSVPKRGSLGLNKTRGCKGEDERGGSGETTSPSERQGYAFSGGEESNRGKRAVDRLGPLKATADGGPPATVTKPVGTHRPTAGSVKKAPSRRNPAKCFLEATSTLEHTQPLPSTGHRASRQQPRGLLVTTAQPRHHHCPASPPPERPA